MASIELLKQRRGSRQSSVASRIGMVPSCRLPLNASSSCIAVSVANQVYAFLATHRRSVHAAILTTPRWKCNIAFYAIM